MLCSGRVTGPEKGVVKYVNDGFNEHRIAVKKTIASHYLSLVVETIEISKAKRLNDFRSKALEIRIRNSLI